MKFRCKIFTFFHCHFENYSDHCCVGNVADAKNNKKMNTENNNTPTQWEQSIIDLNKGKQIVESLGCGDSISFLIDEYNFENYTVQIVKSQWSKTQKTFCVRVHNYSTGKRPHLQIPLDTLKNCKMIINESIEKEYIHFWTGHIVEVGKLLK